MTEPVLQLRGISKRFAGTEVVSGISLDLLPGEIHALVGENGAGKSTLIKIMTGVHQPSAGEVLVDGRAVTIANTQAAQALGVAAIFQEPMVFPDLDVAENIFISHLRLGAFVNWRRMHAEARALIARLGVTLDVTRPASGLTLAEQQTVEIARAISLDVRVLIMDEPTASLSAHEVEQLMKIARTLREQGVAVLYISHRLEEVFALADRVTVLRDGKLISTNPTAAVTGDSLIRDMVGRNLEDYFGREVSHRTGDVLLSVEGLGKAGVFGGVGFEVHRGEILCFAGLIGARRTDVALALFGVEPADAGTIRFDGRPVSIASPRAALRLGIAYVSEDRRKLGLALPMSIVANISLPTLDRFLTGFGLIRRHAEFATAERFRERLNIRTTSLDVEVGKLSGGNQQKVMLSKWLNAEPKLLIVDEPTRGIDVGAKAEVHQIIRDLAAAGVAVIVISSDLPEVMALADRILVMREGRQMGVFDAGDATQEQVMRLATGQTTRQDAA
ncbi:MAG: sugar ABC transporter ATP-binding protein [Alphaproteobacteria bacterium]